jgi:hypothetical protein
MVEMIRIAPPLLLRDPHRLNSPTLKRGTYSAQNVQLLLMEEDA